MPGTSQKESGLPFQGVEGFRAWNGGVAPAYYGRRPPACRVEQQPRHRPLEQNRGVELIRVVHGARYLRPILGSPS
jgi:hypothetical protein